MAPFRVWESPALTITLTHEPPTQVIAGDSIEFLVKIPGDFVTWTGSAVLMGPSSMAATSCVTENSDFHVYFQGLTGVGTEALTSGQYLLTVWATLANDRRTIAQFPLTILPGYESGQASDLGHARRMLTVIEAAIEARLTGNADGGIESYAVEGTSVTKLPMTELQRLRARYAAEVARLQNPNAPIGVIKFHFTQAGGLTDLRTRFPYSGNSGGIT